MTSIGIDLSINSTGICVKKDYNLPVYYIVTPHLTRKQKAVLECVDWITVVHYDKDTEQFELSKTINLTKITQQILSVIDKHHPQRVTIEGLAYGIHSKSLLDLAGLQHILRCELFKRNIPVEIIPPTTLKKIFTGNSHANKEDMINCWTYCDPRCKPYLNLLKLDDLADAYALSCIKK